MVDNEVSRKRPKYMNVPSPAQKESATITFKAFLASSIRRGFVQQWADYSYGFSHDGVIFWNEHANAFSFDEIKMIARFCEDHNFSFSFFSRKTDNVSGYGSVVCEININA